MKLWGKIPPGLILLFFLVLGSAMIFFPHYLLWRWDYGITSEIGVAFVIAAILGLTVDRWLKAELRTNAFLAAIGHILEPEFRAEVSRIVGYKIICERHSQWVEITPVGDKVVRVTASVERMLRNKSTDTQPIKNYIHVDDWGFDPHKSAIIDCIIELSGKITEPQATPTSDAYSLQTATPEVPLEAGASAKLRSKWTEYKSVNDIVFFHFMAPTVDPEIEVVLPAELDCLIGFGTPIQTIEPSHYVNRKKLVGTYFPHQSMSVRWWPKPKH